MSRHLVPLRTAGRAWATVAAQSFGGPAGQIAVMHEELVVRRRWIGEGRFLHALGFCMLLPGPEAQQLAIYLGWLLNGWVGGLLAGVLFVLPGVAALLALSWLYVAHGDTAVVAGLLVGLGPAVVAVVVQAVVRVGGRAVTGPAALALAVGSFVALAVFGVPFPLVVLAALALGWALGRRGLLSAPRAHGVDPDAPEPLVPDSALHAARSSWARTVALLVGGVVVWVTPLVLVEALGGPPVLADQALFFGGTALVTFGGAYAVLSYVAQAAVTTYGWVTPREMVHGLALAESTPGPLIMVVQFVAFVGAYRSPGHLDPWTAAVLGALITTWVTFVPCFVLVFLGAPLVERLREARAWSSALAGVTAAVVGVIANLAVYFALHTLFGEVGRAGVAHLGLPTVDPASARPLAVALTALALWLLLGRGWGVLRLLGLCGLVGVAGQLLGWA